MTEALPANWPVYAALFATGLVMIIIGALLKATRDWRQERRRRIAAAERLARRIEALGRRRPK